MNEHVATMDVPPQREVAGFYDNIGNLMTDLFGGSLHEGYWESPSDSSTMAEASLRLTDLMTDKLQVGPGDKVLDVGCGNGVPAIRLAQMTGAAVIGITNSAAQIRQAVQNAKDAGLSDQLTFRCEDATVLRFPAQSFDAVLMIESIFHLPDRLEALRQVVSVLKPGGRLSLTDILDRSSTDVDKLVEHSSAQERSPLVAQPIRLEEYEGLLEQAGLVPVDMTDVTEHTVAPTIACLKQRLADDHDDLVERHGSQVVQQYASVLPLLEAAYFGYGIVVATLPACR